MSARAPAVTILWLAVAVLAGPDPARANGAHGPETPEPATRFERYLLASCSPCVRAAYSVAALCIAPSRPSGFSPQVVSTMARGGEIRLEVLRAHPLGRPTQQFLAARATLAVLASGGQLYRIAVGVIDEEDLPALAAAVAAMVQAPVAATPPADDADVTETEFHTATVRVGTVRLPGAAVAYVQAAPDIRAVAPPTPLEMQSALVFGIEELPALGQAIEQVMARIQKLRGR
jgi:hypothetical protein